MSLRLPDSISVSATLVDLVRWRALQQPDQLAYTFLVDGETEEACLTYGELDERACAIGAQMQSLGAFGERVLLLYPPGLDYIAAFFGCLYAGAIAVPAYPPDPTRLNRTLPRLQAIVADAQATIVLTLSPILSMAEVLFDQAPDLKALRWLATDQVSRPADEWNGPKIGGDDLAFLQYTSGSTAAPRGVMLTHHNLLHNSARIQAYFEHSPESRGVVWLPPYHDMGLIGGILQPLYGGFPVTLMSPIDFLKRPVRWLQAISRYQATISGGPNFAYDLCARKITPEERARLDLSRWEIAFNGAEPVRRETLERFAETFAECGFRREAFYPCYGLAEATLIVSGGFRAAPPVTLTVSSAALRQNRVEVAPPAHPEAYALVGCGCTLADQQIEVVNPDTLRVCSPGQIGEIWVAGPNVAQGYWNQPDKTTETFHARLDTGAGPYLRTGDLGFLQNDELYVTGRLKDLIIIRGRNHYPQDIELTVEKSHPALRPGCCAAFSISVDGDERLVVAQEVGRQGADANEVIQAIRQAVTEQHELQVYAVMLLEAGSIPKTSSGKIQRHACRAAFLADSLEVAARSVLEIKPVETTPQFDPHLTFIRKALAAVNEPAARQTLLTLFLQEQAARVLRVSTAQVDAQHSLSTLGLDSLMAVELQHAVETGLGVVAPMVDFMQDAGLAQLAAQLLAELEAPAHQPLDLAALADTAQADPILSHGQRAMWFLHQLAPESAAYNISSAVRIRSELDLPALQRAFQALVDRHPSLRTTFLPDGSTPRIHEHAQVFFQAEDASTWNEAALNERLIQAAHTPFDLEHGPLFRVHLFSRSVGEHVLLLVAHHIIADFWSLALLARDLETLYTSERKGMPASLPPLARRYADYAHAQAGRLAGPAGERLWEYWRQQLAGELPALNLPTDRPRPPAQTYRGASQALALSAELTRDLKVLSRAQGVTLYTTLLAAFQTLLYRYTGQHDILVGSPTAGRSAAELADLVGYFVNPVVLRANLAGPPAFIELLNRTRQTVLAAFAHQDYPFSLLVERLQPERDPSRSPLFQVMFIWQQSPLSSHAGLAALALGEAGARLNLGGLSLEAVALEQRAAQFDLTLVMAELAGGLGVSLQYNRDLFDAATIARMLEHWRVLLEGIVAQPEQRLSDLPLLTQSERQQLLAAWNDTLTDYPREKCVHELFEAQAGRTPGATAVAFEDQRLTYQELNERANQLAHYLRTREVKPGVRVAICVDRSPEMLVGLLGILKAGAAYVPLDPAYPEERLAFILEDSRASVLLTQAHLADGLHVLRNANHVIRLDADWPAITQSPITNSQSPATSENLAYVIYTSGSTGKPKGVQIPHRAVVNFLSSMRERPGLAQHDILLSVTTLSFDIAGLELFLPLIAGARVVLVSRDVAADGARLSEALACTGATVMQATPATWRLLLEAGWQGDSRLKILCGGEAFPRELANQLAARSASLWNMYGPTETTIWSTTGQVFDGEGFVPIGDPIANTQIYILDDQLNPAPIGAPGELYIGGEGLAWGYLNRPDLTAEKFIPNPFATTDDERPTTNKAVRPSSFVHRRSSSRLYRTGDLVRYLPDGRIEFLGRIDHQVKVRGFRIELAEIESVLRQHPAVQECVVVAQAWGASADKRLAAYLVPKADLSSSFTLHPSSFIPELRAFLRSKLPEYMLPASFVMLDALPLTPNGKVNRRALPAPEASAGSGATEAPPRSELEQTIAQIWREVLQVERVGIHDNFFDLGGHSLLLARVHRRLREVLPRELTVVELFQYPTIGALARYLSPTEGEAITPRPGAGRARKRRELIKQPEAGIAVIGMTGRFPGAKNLDEFWRNLCEGKESIAFFSDAEVQASGVDPALLADPNYVKAGSVLEDVEAFDADFFGYNPRETEIIDPQHRLFLECAWEVLEHAGYDSERYQGRIGVYAGVGLNSYLLNNLQSNRDLMQSVGGYQTFIGNDKDFVPTRVSYKLNLTGPSVNVQTACSSSLVAIHLACQSLLTGECDMALAGGVSISLPQKAGYLYQERGIASPDGHCRAFDAQAQGTVRGSGVGVVVLKRLAEAVADRDPIYAVIKGSAINNDGSLKVGYTAPSVEGQAEVIAEALAVAGVEPETISYVEAHGTGTEIGDPIEVTALTQAFGNGGGQTGYCALGSLKTNIGHLDTAAGVAGFIKTVLALRQRQIPPSLHFEAPNPQIDFEHSPFYVNTALSGWKAGRAPRRAGVSSFGIGGANAHVVLEEAPPPEPSSATRPWQLLLLSAKTSTALETATANLAAHLKQNPDLNLADAAYTLQVGRHRLNHRRAVICQDAPDAIAALETLDPQRVLTGAQELKERPVAFMFTGQGAQYVGMAQELYQTEPTFREQVDRCAELLQPHLGLDLRDLLYPDLSDERPSSFVHRPPSEGDGILDQTQYTQPALFVTEYALAQLWLEWGVRPQAMIGHSIGEYVAACLAGVFSLEAALALVAARGRLMQQLPGGAMLAVPLPEREAQPWLGGSLSIAAINAPGMCVVSGPTEAIEQLERRLKAQGVEGRRLHTSHAFHSALMEPILEPFTEQVKRVRLNPPRIPCVSNVTGDWLTAAEATDPNYWARHLRQAVRFADGVGRLLAEPTQVLLEVGPGRTLSTLALRHPAKRAEHVVLGSLRHAQDRQSDVAFELSTLGKLWLAGVAVDWAGFYAHEQRRRLPLPTYPFERQRYWIEPQPADQPSARRSVAKKADPADWFYVPSWKRSDLARAVSARPVPSRWLVFVDECGLGAQLIGRLEQAGHDVVRVQVGASFAQLNDRAYALHPAHADDYAALLKDLQGQAKLPQVIVHLWNVTPDDQIGAGLAGFDQTQDRSFYSLLFLAQAIGNHGAPDEIRLAVISSNLQEVIGDESLCPEKATLLGPVQIIPREYPNLSCRSIDVALPQTASQTQPLVEALLTELKVETADPIVAYRGKHRWVQTFEPLRLDKPEASTPRLRHGGVYLITGGLGGMGLTLAQHLAETMQAKLILTGRSALPAAEEWARWLATHDEHDAVSRKIRQVQQLEASGAEVIALRADVTDPAQMQATIAQATAHFGPINGVIHAAGVPGGGVIPLKTREMAERVMAAKIKGALVLSDLLQAAPLDFFILCSSINSVVGRAGQVDYVAANAFLDAFVHASLQPAIGVNWETWREVGMAAATLKELTGAPAASEAPPRKVDHPLLDECIFESETSSAYTTHFTVQRHWVLHEHGVLGKPTLPGTAYLEMARAAYALRAGAGAIEIRDAHFLTPLIAAEDEAKQVRTVLKKQGDAFAFSVLSRSGDAWQEHARGTIAPLGTAAPVGELLNEAEIRCREQTIADPLAQTRLGGFDLQRRTIRRGSSPDGEPLAVDSIVIAETDAQARSMEFGPRWHSLRWVKLGAREGLALLELPETFSADIQLYGLHPALLDLATSCLRLFKSQGSYLPLSYKRLRMWRPLPARIYSHVRFAGGDPAQGVTLRFDVTLLDEQGRALVEIEEFAVMRIDDVGKLGAVSRSAALSPALSENGHVSGGSEALVRLLQDDLKDGLSSADGIAVFERVLGSGLRRVVVSTRDLAARIERSRARAPETAHDAAAPKPKHPRPPLLTAYAAPRNQVEQQLAEIWQGVLGIDAVGVHDNFFDLGGDSLLITQIHSRLKTRFDTDLSIASLMQYPTIAQLAPLLNRENGAELAGLEAARDRASRQKEALKQRKQKLLKKNKPDSTRQGSA